jgi:hypothetical protein
MLPWLGMSRLWWASLVWPLVSVSLIWVVTHSQMRERQPAACLARYVALSAVVLGVAAWLVGGLADRYLVAPNILAAIALILTQPVMRRSALLVWIGIGALSAYAALAVGAFAPRQFLRDGLAWREAVVAARAECAAMGAATVRIDTVGGAIDAAPCELFGD